MKTKIQLSLQKLGMSVIMMLFLSTAVYAQQITVSGTVTSENTGEALPGVNIVVVGNESTGTVSDLEGNYSLRASSGDILRFTYVGYVSQTVPVDSRTQINVQLAEDTQMLDDLIVVGYSMKRESELSSAVVVLDETELRTVQSQDFATLLQGKVAGVTVSNVSGRPGSSAEIVIRGAGSIGAGHTPLYVVDGSVGSSPPNPNDIASITILKDAAATGLYGSRASNGVIVITTKMGQSGRTVISYTGSTAFSRHNDGNLELMNSQELYELQTTGHRNYYDDMVAAGNPNFTDRSFNDYLQSVLPSSLLERDADWPSQLTRTGVLNDHNLSISGGNERTTFYVSGSLFDELGTVSSLSYTNVNLNANLQHDINDRFKLTLRASGREYSRPNEPRYDGLFNQYHLNLPWDLPFHENGTPYNPAQSGTEWRGNNRSNYFYDSEHYSDLTKGTSFGTSARLDVTINDWLNFSSTNGVGFSHTDRTQLLDKYHRAATADQGTLSQTYSYSKSYNTSNLLRMDRNFDSHSLSGILGQEYSYSESNSTGAVGMDIVDGLSALSSAGSPKSISGSFSETAFMSFFGQLDYNYMSRYFLVGSLRRDASSRFGANNQWGTFYSAGASWLLSNEAFMSEADWVDLLRLRVSYGTTGNANISNYLSLGTFSFSNVATYDGAAGARSARLPNPNLSWEIAYTTNIGIEFSFLRRATVEIDLYDKLTKDLLQAVPLSAASGFSSQQRNVGSIQNRGIDFIVDVDVIDRNNFSWDVGMNMNINKNEVLSLDQGNDIFSTNMIIREGLPLRYFYMKDWAGVNPDNGDPLWVRWEDQDGNIIHGADKVDPANITTTSNYNEASNVLIGSAYPDVTGGLRSNLYYKNFHFGIVGTFAVGQLVYNGQNSALDSDGQRFYYNQRKLHDSWNRWEKPGDQATHPRLIAGGNKGAADVSSRFIEEASYFRVQHVRIGYTFGESVPGIRNLRVYTSLDNPVIFTNFSGSDPDFNMENPSVTSDAGSARYAPAKKLTFGISFDI